MAQRVRTRTSLHSLDRTEEPSTVLREGLNLMAPHMDDVMRLCRETSALQKESTVLREGLNLMAPLMDDVMHMCRETSAHAEIKVTVKHVTKGAMCAGGGALVGGLLGGPPGMLIGGAMGTLYGWMTSAKFRPLPQILMELSPDQRQKLYDKLAPFLINLVWENKAQLVALVTGNATLLQQVTTVVRNYVTRELGLNVF